MTTIDETPWPGPYSLEDDSWLLAFDKDIDSPRFSRFAPARVNQQIPKPGEFFYKDGELIGIVASLAEKDELGRMTIRVLRTSS